MPVVDQIVKTGDSEKNGAVKPNEAVLIKSFRIQEWPVEWPRKSDGGGVSIPLF
jgi:hypothetical protein